MAGRGMHPGFNGKTRRKETLNRHRRTYELILKWILEEQNGVVWTGFSLLRMKMNGGLL
jgi:hypothetical protein